MDRHSPTLEHRDSDSEALSCRTLSPEHNIKAENCDSSGTAYPEEPSSSSHPPTLVECPQLPVDQNGQNHSIRDEVQRVKQEVMEDEEVAWKTETRDIKLEVKQEHHSGQRFKDEIPEFHRRNGLTQKGDPYQQPGFGPRPRQRVPLRPLDPYEWPRRTPWLQHGEAPRHLVSVASHDNESAALYPENIRHPSQIHQSKYGIRSEPNWRESRESRRWPVTSAFNRPTYSQQYPFPSPSPYPVFDCFCKEPYDREQFRVPWKVDRRGEGTPQPQPVQQSRRAGTERQPSHDPQQYGQQRQEQTHQEHHDTEPRSSQPHRPSQRENVPEQTPAPYEPRTAPPLPHREDGHDGQKSKPKSRKRRTDDEPDKAHKRARLEQTPSEQTSSEQTPAAQSYPNTRSRAASTRQQNYSTRELRPNDNVIRFGLDVWFHGPGSTIRPLTTDEFANSFDNTVAISGSGSFTFTSTAPATGEREPNQESATNATPVEVTVAVTTAVTAAVTAALASATTASTATSTHTISLPPPETREARRARIIQEQRDQLRRVNEQQMQGYDEAVRRQTMWRVAHEAEQLQRLQEWRWENDPALASQGIILPPLMQNQPLLAQTRPLFSQSSQPHANTQTARAHYASPLQAPIDLMSGQAPSDTYNTQPYYGGGYDQNGRGAYGDTFTPRTPVLQPSSTNVPPHGQDYQLFQTPDPTLYRDAPASDDSRTLMSPPQLVSQFHLQDRPLSQAGPPSESPQSPQTPQFHNTVGEYTHHPNQAVLGTARPSWTAVRENGYGDEMQSGGQGISGYGNGCSCADCYSQRGPYGSSGASH